MRRQNPGRMEATAIGVNQSDSELREHGLRILARVIARCLMKGNAESRIGEESGDRSAVGGLRYGGQQDEF